MIKKNKFKSCLFLQVRTTCEAGTRRARPFIPEPRRVRLFGQKQTKKKPSKIKSDCIKLPASTCERFWPPRPDSTRVVCVIRNPARLPPADSPVQRKPEVSGCIRRGLRNELHQALDKLLLLSVCGSRTLRQQAGRGQWTEAQLRLEAGGWSTETVECQWRDLRSHTLDFV